MGHAGVIWGDWEYRMEGWDHDRRQLMSRFSDGTVVASVDSSRDWVVARLRLKAWLSLGYRGAVETGIIREGGAFDWDSRMNRGIMAVHAPKRASGCENGLAVVEGALNAEIVRAIEAANAYYGQVELYS